MLDHCLSPLNSLAGGWTTRKTQARPSRLLFLENEPREIPRLKLQEQMDDGIDMVLIMDSGLTTKVLLNLHRSTIWEAFPIFPGFVASFLLSRILAQEISPCLF